LKPLEVLTQINLDDLVDSFGWQNHPFLARSLRRLFHEPARRFAKNVLEFDAAVGDCGLADAARLTQRHYVRDVRVFGLDLIPRSAFLALSNHPGMSDTLSVFSALNRPGLKVIALDRPFLRAMPNTSKHLFYVKEETSFRMNLVRQVSSHLRTGGSALTFPAGHIEPDPDVYEGAIESLETWTESVGVFIRMAPDTAMLPILVRGVIWDKTATHWLLQIKKTKEEREKLAAAFQVLAHMMWNARPVTVRVQIGRPIYAKDLGTTETAILHQAVLMEMQRLIECPPEGEGISVL